MSARLKHIPLPAAVEVAGDAVRLVLGKPGAPSCIRLAWNGSAEQAADIARALNAHPRMVAALSAARADCRDPDTDSALSADTGEKIDAALAAAEGHP